MLADLGATVLKVEAPSGDNLRGVGRMFRSAAAGKRSIAADLHDPDCAKLFEALVRWADVAHHNLRPRVFTRLGMDGASVRRINPEVIFGYSPGWGSTGANADRQSLEPHMSGYAGVAYEAAGQWNEPVYPICNSDVGNGLVGAVGIMIALVERLRTGRGRTYENAHLNAAMMHVAHIVRGADGEAIGADRLDPMQFGFGPYERLYMTSDGWICIAAMTPDEIAGLWTAIARHQPAEADNDQLGDIIAEAIGTRTTTHWLQALDAHGVPAVEPSPYNAALFLRDPENRKSGRVAECDHPTLGRLRELALLVRVSDCDELTHRLAPELGADTMELLRWAGYDDETIAALNNQGVVRCTSAADGSSIG